MRPTTNIQLGMELWDRAREYDARMANAAPDITDGAQPARTRTQKQKFKVQAVPTQPTSKPRVRGDNRAAPK